MTPKRLLPYLLIFLALTGAYVGLQWRQARQDTQEQQAKKVFPVKEGEIDALTLRRGSQETRLVKEGHDWRLISPLKAKADQAVVDAMLVTLATLQQNRDLGPQSDLKLFGLDPPGLVVEFTAQGQPRRLAIGGQVPGGKSYYALKDQDSNPLLIDFRGKETLDRPLLALRDKTLLAFSPEQVKGLTITTGKTAVRLEKTGPQVWRWVGRDDVVVRGDRVETLLRQLHHARVKDFLDAPPKNLRALGLAPRPQTELTLSLDQGQDTLSLGAGKGDALYARKGARGPVVLVEPDLAAEITKAASSLEDRRLWAGPVTEVHQVVWGPPNKPFVAVKEHGSWKITPPGGAAFTASKMRLEMALWNLQNLEYARILPSAGASPAPPVYIVELFDQADQLLFRLVELGQKGKTEVEVRTQQGDKKVTALVARKNFTSWQEEMAQLTTPLNQ